MRNEALAGLKKEVDRETQNVSKSVVERLQDHVADMSVLSQKMYHYHWNADKDLFTEAHKKLEEYSRKLKKFRDQLANLADKHSHKNGGSVPGTFSQQLDRSRLDESEHVPKAKPMASEIVDDMTKVFSSLKKTQSMADDIDLHDVVNTIREQSKEIDDRIWEMEEYLEE